jgi:hypothetical protein
MAGLPPLTREQQLAFRVNNNAFGNLANRDGQEWTPDRDRRGGRKTYRKRISRRKTKKHI